MSQRQYDGDVVEELRSLILLAEVKERETRLRSVSTAVNRWKKGTIDARTALAEVKRLASAPSMTWTDGADPGVAVAHALAGGLLKKTDISDKAWKSIEVQVTLVEI